MEAPPARACPSCSAPAQSSQRWCLECGHELPQSRRGGLRPAVGIATTLGVLVLAASAGAYGILQTDKQPPPPPTTVAQAPPAATPPAAATQEPAPSTYSNTPSYPLPSYSSPTTGGSTYNGTTTTSTTPNGGAGDGGNGGTTTTGNTSGGGTATTAKPPPPRNVITNIALGAVTVVYAPYTASDVDLGDASRVADDSTKTAWKTPPVADPGIAPQAGVYVDLASPEKLKRLVLKTPTPGMSIEVYGAVKGPPELITGAGWDHVASRADLKSRTSITLPDKPFRYVLVWVTGLPPDTTRAAISELALLSLQPE